ncbi:MAG: beta-propeller domain-containing protein, partial [Lachnospiraceae bacterium]
MRIPLGELLKKASSYEEVQEALKPYEYFLDYDYGYLYAEEKGLANAAKGADRTESDAAPTEAEQGTSDHSSTNLREANVDEGDVVKTDGKFIYQLKNDSKIRIIRANGGSLEEASLLEPAFDGSGDILDMYLAGDQLVLITYEKSSGLSKNEDDAYYVNQKSETHVRTYNLGDRTAPKEVGNVVLEGRYETSRLTGGVVYVITDKTHDRFYPVMYRNVEPVREYTLLEELFDWLDDMFPAADGETYSGAATSRRGSSETESTESTVEAFDEEKFLSEGTVPKVNGEYLTADSIYVPKLQSFSRSWLISSVRLSDPTKAADAQLICTDLSEIYVSANAIFLMGMSEADYDGSNVIRVDFADGAIRPTGAAYLPGTVDDSFSVSESGDGHFRAAVTRGWNGTNSVYVFDKEMNLVGSLENIIEGEEIKSARYIGNILYLVTYRNTDPLFSVDLSDPAAPKLLGELKIPGFSEYLHPYGDGRLLGLGYETDPKTGETLGTKLSLFDISDPVNVKELSKLVLRNVEPSVAFENYKAVLADPDKNLFGFAANEAWWTYRWEDEPELWDDVKIFEEGEELAEETLAKDGEESSEASSASTAEGLVHVETSADNVAEGLVFADGTTQAVSDEKKTDGSDSEDEKKDDGRTADVRMHGNSAYLLFSVENDEIVCRLVRSLDEGETGSRQRYTYYEPQNDCRGIYIGDTFYIVEKN